MGVVCGCGESIWTVGVVRAVGGVCGCSMWVW